MSILFIMFKADSLAQVQQLQASNNDENFVADRPGQTIPPTLVPKAAIQIEAGIWRDQHREGGRSQITWLYPTTVIRFGIKENWELRSQFDVVGLPSNMNNQSASGSGFSGISIGSKFSMTEEYKYIPKSCFLFAIKLPYFGARTLRPKNITPSMGFAFQNTVTNVLSAGYGLNLNWDGSDAASQQLFSVSLNFAIDNRWGMYGEYYLNTAEDSDPSHACDLGVSYLLFKNFQLDMSGGFGLNEKAPDFSLGMGIAWKL